MASGRIVFQFVIIKGKTCYNVYRLIKDYTDGHRLIQKGEIVKLAGIELSTHSKYSPFFLFGFSDPIRIPNDCVEKLEILSF